MIPRWSGHRPGQNLVEFALILPVFFAMFFGIIEGGWLLYNQNQVTNAAREGARFASVNGARSQGFGSGSPQEASYVVDAGAVEAVILDRVTLTDSDALTVTVDLPDGNMAPGNNVTVNVAYDYQPIIGYVLGTAVIELSSSSTRIINF